LQISCSWWWEKVQFGPAVHLPLLKNLQGIDVVERSEASGRNEILRSRMILKTFGKGNVCAALAKRRCFSVVLDHMGKGR
jgi:hypothetical protein